MRWFYCMSCWTLSLRPNTYIHHHRCLSLIPVLLWRTTVNGPGPFVVWLVVQRLLIGTASLPPNLLQREFVSTLCAFMLGLLP